MSMTIDKQVGDVCFNEEKHVYFHAKDPKKKYTSVTTLIHKFEPPFDQDFWSAYKTLEQIMEPDYWKVARAELLEKKAIPDKFFQAYNIDMDLYNEVQQNILDNWQKENLASTYRGSDIHANLEHSFYAQKNNISLQKYGVGGSFTCIKGKTELDLENGIYPEYLIYWESPDEKVRIAGQIDLLVKKGNQFSIIDWKGLPLDTKIPVQHGWKTMGELKVGDKVFDKDGRICSVIHKSEVHHNPCYKITFDTGESIIADIDHRWLVNIQNEPDYEFIFTTKRIQEYMREHPDVKLVIQDNKPLKIIDGDPLPMDTVKINTSIEFILQNIKVSLRNTLNKRKRLYELVTPYMCMDEKGFYLPNHGCNAEFKEFLNTLGFRAWIEDDRVYTPYIGTPGNGQLCRVIEKVESVKMVPTQCIEVDSPSHTYLCTEMFLVTHNTNKQIKTKSYFNKKTKSSEKLKYPLNTLDNCNYSVYNMQLSTYAWMIEQLHPELKCNELVLVHFDHNNNMTTYNMPYLKEEVRKMLDFWKRDSILEAHRAARKRIEY